MNLEQPIFHFALDISPKAVYTKSHFGKLLFPPFFGSKHKGLGKILVLDFVQSSWEQHRNVLFLPKLLSRIESQGNNQINSEYDTFYKTTALDSSKNLKNKAKQKGQGWK